MLVLSFPLDYDYECQSSIKRLLGEPMTEHQKEYLADGLREVANFTRREEVSKMDILPGVVLILGIVVGGLAFTAYALWSDRRAHRKP